MAEVKILLKGYVSDETGGHSCSTVTLVRNGKIRMVIDPGTLPSRNVLVDALKKEGIIPEDVNFVGITHSHMDHYRSIGMFPNASAVDYWGIWKKDVWKECKGNLSDDIRIVKTPGHSYDSITFLVKTKNDIVAICGDVFWKEGYPQDDPYAQDREKLQESRKYILKTADFIIPGHGEMFRTA
ncbi:MAG: MBL fold metallo-hydrolase [Candidatus Micrarchaeota archaeon]|nr:MBL fold metallo-hydrolase [Candidatus Micrarchaeota archaeon]